MFRGVIWLYPIPLSIQELNWMVLGERVAHGFLLYKDIWDTTAPFSAGVYALMHLCFGKSQLAYQVVAFVLTLLQCFQFMYIMRKNDVFNEKTYLPGFIYLVLMNLFFDFFTLSPMLLANTFLLFAIDQVFYHIRHRTSDAGIFSTGFFISLASMFYLPCASFIIFLVFAFLFFSRTNFRQYLLLFIGFTFPSGIVLFFFFWKNALFEFMFNFVFSYIYLESESIYSAPVFMVILIVPLTIVGMAVMKLIGSNRHINYQIICQQLMFFWMILSILVFVFSEKKGGYQLMPIIPAAAFYINHYLIAVKKKIFAELTMLMLIISTLYINFDSLYGGVLESTIINTQETFVKHHQYDHLLKNRKILVLGHAHSIYKNNSLATPYLNWGLAENHFGNLDSYNNVIGIYENFKQDMPEYIIDETGLLEKVFDRIPSLQAQYQSFGYEGVYELKSIEK